MKSFKILLVAAMTVLFMSCNNQPKADKNMDDDAILLENANVKDEKARDSENRSKGSDTIRTDSVRYDNE